MSLLFSSESPAGYTAALCSTPSNATSAMECALCSSWQNLSAAPLPASFAGAIPASEDPRIEALRRYSYGVALPSICLLGIVGNVFNLIVLTRRNMRGTAYIYMRDADYRRRLDNCVPRRPPRNAVEIRKEFASSFHH